MSPFLLRLAATSLMLAACSSSVGSSGADHGSSDGEAGSDGSTPEDAASTKDASQVDAPSVSRASMDAADAVTGDAGLPAIDPTLAVSTLTSDQDAQLCDWLNAELGGYGVTTDCGYGISTSNAANQADCKATQLQFRCAVTVGQLETCIKAESPSHACMVPMPDCAAAFCQ